jgi:hypothetical protein
LTASASDADQPPQSLTFSLAPGAPFGAAINPSTGLLTWTPSNAPATNQITVVVTDNGMPNLNATQAFSVTVFLPPYLAGATLSGNQLVFAFQTVSGQGYQLEYKDVLLPGPWTAIGPPILGTGGWLSLTNDVSLSSERFYHIKLVP